MKRVCVLREGAELELLRNMLEQAGVRCSLRNEQLSQTLPATPFNVELWVENDEDFPKAQGFCQGWLESKAGSNATWLCAECGQRLAEQFDSCWKCGAKR